MDELTCGALEFEDEEVFSVSKIKPENRALIDRNNRRLEVAKTSLKFLAIEAILKNKNLFCNVATEHNCDPFSSISPVLKAELVDAMTKVSSQGEVELDCQTLEMLLNKEVVAFRFPEFFPLGRPANITALWKTLILKCPNLRTLRSECFAHESEGMCILKPFYIRVSQFSQLEELQLCDKFKCDDLYLCEISTHLTELRILSVQLSENVSEKGISALTKLHNLREFTGFIGQGIKHSQMNRRFARLCFTLLPHLHIMGLDFNAHFDSYPRALSDIKMELLLCLGELGLQRLAINFMERLPKYLSLPNLSAFLLSTPIGTFVPDERLSNVSELYLCDVEIDKCIPLIKFVGRQLRILSINTCDSFSLDSVLLMCPNLVELYMKWDGCTTLLTISSGLEPENLASLKKLSLTCIDSDRSMMDRGLLLMLLMAPNLCHVKFSDMVLSQEEADGIIRGVQEKTILQRLENFEYFAAFFDPDFHNFNLVLEAVSTYCHGASCGYGCTTL